MPASQIWAFICTVILGIADFIIAFLRRTRSNERTIRPTERISWPKGLKRDLMRMQSNTCPYCGSRKTIRTMDIDHMTPAVRGGSNARSNLQVTCRPCNQRKGMMTDQEFRQRYRRLVPQSRLTPPPAPVPQSAFKRETKVTEQPESVRQFRATKFISNRKKITSGSLAIGVFVFFLNFVMVGGFWFPGIDGILLLAISVIPAMVLGGGLYFRAMLTGMLED